MSKTLVVCDEKKSPNGKIVKVCVKILEDLMKRAVVSEDFFGGPVENFERTYSRTYQDWSEEKCLS
ncbi:MAG: hypothetical protein QXV03_04055 [Sulfolobales archaeon]